MELIQTLLLEALTGELQAELRYGQCALQARQEGLPNVGILFAALSRAEAIHAANHKRALAKNGYDGALPKASDEVQLLTTKDNLRLAIETEKSEYKTMYPAMEKKIRAVYKGRFEAKIALLSMRWACESEQEHFALLQKAFAAVESGRDLDGEVYLCSVCGNIHVGTAPEKLCPVCGHDLSFYRKVVP